MMCSYISSLSTINLGCSTTIFANSSNVSLGYTAPLGLLGEHKINNLDRSVMAARSFSGVIRNPSSAVVRTTTLSAPDNRTISG